jgi:hypothetical protein
MRVGSIILAIAAAAFAWSVSAQPADDPGTDHYFAELDRQCQASQLQLLSSAQLHDGLDDFVSNLPQESQDRIRKAEIANCSSSDAGVGCVDDADIGVVDQLGLTERLASSICAAFLRCRSQGDCDSTR